jgi:hypothetical protein
VIIRKTKVYLTSFRYFWSVMSARAVQGGGNSGSSAGVAVGVYVMGRPKYAAVMLAPGTTAVLGLEAQIYQQLNAELRNWGRGGFMLQMVPDDVPTKNAMRADFQALDDPDAKVEITPKTRIVVVPLNTAAAPVLQGQTIITHQQVRDSSAPSAVAPASSAAAVVGGTDMPVDPAGALAIALEKMTIAFQAIDKNMTDMSMATAEAVVKALEERGALSSAGTVSTHSGNRSRQTTFKNRG